MNNLLHKISLKNFAIILILILASFSMSFSQLTPLAVRQMEYISPWNEAPSTTASLVAEIPPNGRLYFVNVFARKTGQTEYGWIIQNVPIPPFDGQERIVYWFDLADIGFVEGEFAEMIEIFIDTESYFLEMPQNLPPTVFEPIPVYLAPYYVGSEGMINPPDYTLEPFEILPALYEEIDVETIMTFLRDFIVYRGCNVPNIDLDSVAHGPTSDYAGDKNACAPAGAANSMQWLEQQHREIRTGTDLRQKLVELSALMGREDNSGVTTEQFIEGKLAYIDANELPISVKFQSSNTDRDDDIESPLSLYGHKAKNQNANKDNTDKSVLTWEWLYNEMKNGEDVEIGMEFYEWDGNEWVSTGAHIATVSGVSQVGGSRRIWLKDDAEQLGEGGTEQNALTWLTIGDFELPILEEWSKGSKATVITDVVSESFDQNVQFSMYTPSIQFKWLKYITPINTSFSTAASFDATVLPHDDTKFVNVSMRAPGSEKEVWVVDNLKLYPFDEPVYASYMFSTDSLVDGNPWMLDSVEVQMSVTDNILEEPVIYPEMWQIVPASIEDISTGAVSSGTFSNASGTYTTTEKIRDIWRELNNPTYDSTHTTTVDINHGCTFTNIDLDNSRHPYDSASGYSGDNLSCAPAAAANSMQWLSNEHDEIDFDENMDDPREKLEELNRLMRTSRTNGTPAVNFIEGKMAFIEKYRLPIKVKFQGIFYGDSTEITAPSSTFNKKAVSHNASDSAFPTREWLEQEIRDDEDVEISYGYYHATIPPGGMNGFRLTLTRRGGHKVAVTGINDDGNVVKIKFKHDRRQGRRNSPPDTVDTREEEMTWQTFETQRGDVVVLGRPYRGSDGRSYIRIVEDVVSESYDSTAQYTVNESSMEMNQTNMVEPEQQESSTGSFFSALFYPSEEMKYFQLNAMSIDNAEEVWLVQNLPIAPFPRTRSLSYGVDLSVLGLTPGTDLDSITISYAITDNVIGALPETREPIKIEVGSVEYDVPHGFIFDKDIDEDIGEIPDLVFDVTQQLSDTVYRGCEVSNINLNSSEYGPDHVPGYAGDRNACGPASAANSLHWLERTHPRIDSTNTLRQKLYELSEFMQRQRNQGVSSCENFIKGKLAYIDKYRLPIKVKFQSYEIHPDSTVNSPDTTNGRGYGHSADNQRDADSQFPTWDWLKREMQHGEDVELLLAWRSGGELRGHAVTVTGVAETGRVRRMWIKDDTRQRSEGLGRARRRHIDENGEEVLEWRVDNRGRPYIRRYGRGVRFIHSAISESYDSTVQFGVQRSTSRFRRVHSIDPAGPRNSLNGNFSIVFNPTDAISYINVIARMDTSTEPAWIVRNMPAMPFDEYRNISYGFDLGLLGLTEGQDLDSIEYSLMVSDRYLTSAPLPEYWKMTPMERMNINIGIGSIEDMMKNPFPIEKVPFGDFVPELPAIDIVYRGCKVPNIDLDSSKYNPTTDTSYAGDKNACGPAAAANSMQWLEKVHKEIDSKISHRDKLKELSEFMNRQDNRGVYTKNFIEAKLKFIQKHKLPIEVKFQSFRFDKDSVLKSKDTDGKELKAQNKNTKDRGYPTWEFLVKEMKDGEDVELEYGKYDTSGNRKGGHWVTVTGTISIGGSRGIFIKDDLRQDTSGLGRKTNDRDATGEEYIPWDTTSTGIPLVKRWGSSSRRVESIVSESYKKPIVKKLDIQKFSKMLREALSPIKTKGSITYKPVEHSGEKPLYANLMAREVGGQREYWFGKNLVLLPEHDSIYSVYWFDFEALEKALDKILTLDEVEISVSVDEDPWTEEQAGVDWETIPIESIEYFVATALNENAIVPTSSPGNGLEYSKPDNIETYFRDLNLHLIDLDSQNDDPQYSGTYTGDENSGAPAAVATSMHYLDSAYEEIDMSTVKRQSLEMLGSYMSGLPGVGVTMMNLVKGKLAFIDSVKVPVSVKYQTPAISEDTIASPVPTFSHKADRQQGDQDGYPTFEFLKQELDDNKAVELCIQWILPDGTVLLGQVMAVSGYSNAAGVNSLWLTDDIRQDTAGGNTLHHVTWDYAEDGQPVIHELSVSDTLCYIVGLISQGYDENVTFLPDAVGDEQQLVPELKVISNPSEKSSLVGIIVNMPVSREATIRIYDIKGREVYSLFNGLLETGTHNLEWDASDSQGMALPAGTYIIVLRDREMQVSTKLIIK